METVIRTYIFVFLNSHSNLTMWGYVCWQHFNGRNENVKNYKNPKQIKNNNVKRDGNIIY